MLWFRRRKAKQAALIEALIMMVEPAGSGEQHEAIRAAIAELDADNEQALAITTRTSERVAASAEHDDDCWIACPHGTPRLTWAGFPERERRARSHPE